MGLLNHNQLIKHYIETAADSIGNMDAGDTNRDLYAALTRLVQAAALMQEKILMLEKKTGM